MDDLYILDDNDEPVRVNYLRWAAWQAANPERRVLAQTEVDDRLISTVFLGLDHNFLGRGDALLWETAVSAPDGAGGWDILARHAGRQDAENGHAEAVRLAREGLLP